MYDLNGTDTIEVLRFCNPEDLANVSDAKRLDFPICIPSNEYRQLRHELENGDIHIQLEVSMKIEDIDSDEEYRSLYLEARGKAFLKTNVVDSKLVSYEIERDYFNSILVADTDPNVQACIFLVES